MIRRSTCCRAAQKLIEQRLGSSSRLSELLSWRALLHGLLDEPAEVESALREIMQRVKAGDAYLNPLRVARILLVAKEPDEALASLEQAMKTARSEGATPTLGISSAYAIRNELRYHPAWDPLRRNPRFEALLKTSEAKKP